MHVSFDEVRAGPKADDAAYLTVLSVTGAYIKAPPVAPAVVLAVAAGAIILVWANAVIDVRDNTATAISFLFMIVPIFRSMNVKRGG